MSKPSHSGKLIALIVIVIVGAAAGYGYIKQSFNLNSDTKEQSASTAEAATNAPADSKLDTEVLKVHPTDIALGDHNALVTIVEYSSLSCPHCAHFHETVLPDLDKEFITPGKVRLVIRHFPLNAPALKAAEIVECAGQAGLDRANFIKVLFDLQPKWAYDENYLKSLKQIALVGGLDSAGFDSCVADKLLETKILATRKEGEEKLHIDGTPAFFVNGVHLKGTPDLDNFRAAIKDAAAK